MDQNIWIDPEIRRMQEKKQKFLDRQALLAGVGHPNMGRIYQMKPGEADRLLQKYTSKPDTSKVMKSIDKPSDCSESGK